MADKLMPWELIKLMRTRRNQFFEQCRSALGYGDKLAAEHMAYAGRVADRYHDEFLKSLNNLAYALEEEAGKADLRAGMDCGRHEQCRQWGRADALRDVAKRLRGGK